MNEIKTAKELELTYCKKSMHQNEEHRAGYFNGAQEVAQNEYSELLKSYTAQKKELERAKELLKRSAMVAGSLSLYDEIEQFLTSKENRNEK